MRWTYGMGTSREAGGGGRVLTPAGGRATGLHCNSYDDVASPRARRPWDYELLATMPSLSFVLPDSNLAELLAFVLERTARRLRSRIVRASTYSTTIRLR